MNNSSLMDHLHKLVLSMLLDGVLLMGNLHWVQALLFTNVCQETFTTFTIKVLENNVLLLS